MAEFVNTHKELGRGAFGKVRLAIHQKTGEKVAIKTLYKEKYERLNLEYPPKELAIIKCLKHPNIVQLYEIIQLSDRIHIVMEYVEGKSLADVIPREGIDEKYARRIFREIALAVDYIHSKGVVHRDLKLDNILLNNYSLNHPEQAMIKIIDFGFSNSYDNITPMTTFCGTQEYAAPELLKGIPYYGTTVDIWAMGVILYTLVVGSFPFNSHFETIQIQYTLPDTISPSLKDLISKFFVFDPQQRITLRDVFLHPWTNTLFGGPPRQISSEEEFDPSIVDAMKKMGYPHPESSILELSSATTIYYLMKKKMENLPHQANTDQNKKCIIS